MSETIIIAIITGGVTLTCNLLANHSASKKESVKQARRDQKLDDRLDRLEKKVDEHNGWGEKFLSTETSIKVIQKDIEWLKSSEK